MSDETRVARRENNVITRREENSGTERLFSEFNKVFVSGRIQPRGTVGKILSNKSQSRKIKWDRRFSSNNGI